MNILKKQDFLDLEKEIYDKDLAWDVEHFSVLKKRLNENQILDENDFAKQAVYVILASGFSQKTARKKWIEISKYLEESSQKPELQKLLLIFNNNLKMKAVEDVWNKKSFYRNNYYKQKTLEDKIIFLQTIPYIGKTTVNHLSRNLGENLVKYDIWIQRLGIKISGCEKDLDLIKFPVDKKIKKYCDNIFNEISTQTGYKRGYIDLILWKASQEKLFK